MSTILRTVCGVALLAGAGLAVGHAAERAPLVPGGVELQIGPETTGITAPLDRDGYPDYVAALNERLSAEVAREENFWVLMWPAIGNAERSSEKYIEQVERRLGVSIARESRLQNHVQLAGLQYNTPEAERLNEQWYETTKRPWTADEFPEIARWLEANAQVLDEVHAACQRPGAYAPIIAGENDRPQLIAILLPHVQAMREVARLLSSRAMLRLGEGDVDGAWQDLLDMQRLAGHCERGWTLIEALVGYAIRAIALEPTAHWIGRCGLGAKELRARQAELQPLLAAAPMHRSIDTERFMYLDTVITLMAGRANPREVQGLLGPAAIVDGDQTEDSLRNARQMMLHLMPLGGDVNETLRYGNRMYDELIEALKPATHLLRAERLKVIEDRIGKDNRLTQDTGALVRTYLFASQKEVQSIPGRVMTGLLMPAISQVEKAHTRTQAYAAVLNGAFQACLHREREGTLPLTWADLIQDESAPLLLDPFTGGPLLIRRDEAGVTIYSVGINGQDDSGRTYGEGEGVDDLRVLVPVWE